MKQKIVNKVYIVSVVKNRKVVNIITGKNLGDILYTIKMKYGNCEVEVMEYNDVYNIYVPDKEEYLMRIRQMYRKSK